MSAKKCGFRPDDQVEFAFGEMSPQRAKLFEEHLKSCPACQQAVAELSKASELCRKARERQVDAPVWTKPFVALEKASPALWRLRWVAILSPAAVAACVWLGWIVFGSSPPHPLPQTEVSSFPITVTKARGQVWIQRGAGEATPPTEGTQLQDGECITTSSSSSVALRLEDGSQIYLSPESKLEIEHSGPDGDRHRLITGGVSCQVHPRQPTRPFWLTADVHRVSVVGTIFGVQRKDNNPLVVGVMNGVVEIAALGGFEPPIRLSSHEECVLKKSSPGFKKTLGKEMQGLMQIFLEVKSTAEQPPPLQPVRLADHRTALPEKQASLQEPPLNLDPNAMLPAKPGPDSLKVLVESLYQDIGWIFSDFRKNMQEGNYQTVLERLENYLMDPESPYRDEATFLKAVCLEELGRLPEALDTYRKYLQNWPHGKRALDARLGKIRTGGW